MRKKRSSHAGRRRRGIYVLPSFITLANMFFGYYGLIEALRGKFSLAVTFVLIAAFLDLMDGRIARMTKTQTDFGKELDSLADLFSFGIVPAVIVYLYALQPMGRLGWLLTFFYTACGAIRLARFNILASEGTGSTFIGLPIPMSAGILVLSMLHLPPSSILFPFIVFILGCAMVSNLPYPSFKHLDVRSMRPTYTLILLVLLFFIVAYRPTISLTGLIIIYFFLGPLLQVRKMIQARRSLQSESSKSS